MENQAAVIDAGMTESLALGVVRLGLGDRVMNLATRDIGLNQAADMYLTHVRAAAESVGVAASDVSLSNDTLKEVFALTRNGHLSSENVSALMVLLLRRPTESVEALAKSVDLLTINGVTELSAAVNEAVAKLELTPAEFSAMSLKARQKVRNRLKGIIRQTVKSPNMRLVGRILEETLRADAD
ncbi:MAG: hypothetical protein ACRDQZ_22275 [Mycobacteriales bacterium]